MAQNTNKTVPAATWTQLTNADVTNITFQNLSPRFGMLVKGTTDATQPTDDLGAAYFPPGEGKENADLSTLFSGISAVRLWAFSGNAITVFVSHA